ncbi:MAG: hypothetical protein AB7I48_23990 [Planctomycetaceae bacterium]
MNQLAAMLNDLQLLLPFWDEANPVIRMENGLRRFVLNRRGEPVR